MAGCGGRIKSGIPQNLLRAAMDTIILTAGCAKYRYNKLELRDIN